MSSPLQALHNVRKLLRLYREESVEDASVPCAYYDAFQIAKFNGDMARAKVFAERAAATRLILEGDDSPMNDIDLEYFESADGFTYAPRKHWCFLTEVLNVEYLMRLRLNVKGRDGRETPVFFYTEDRGRSLLDSLHVQEGFTVAILYAEKHGFLDMTAGIRQEDSKSIKIFPVPLDRLLALSDRVQQYATEANGERTCQGCNRKASTLKKCSRCGLAWYCDKAVSWNDKGHKADCKLLKDLDVQLLFKLQAQGFTEPYQFSAR
ncbi:hypothetical protein ACO1O0_005586 [Amphichorda felina]